MNTTHKILFVIVNIFNVACFVIGIVDVICGGIFIYNAINSIKKYDSEGGSIYFFFSIAFLIIGFIFVINSIVGFLYVKHHCRYQFKGAKKFLIINMVGIFCCTLISSLFGFVFFPHFFLTFFGFITFFCSIRLLTYYNSIIDNEVIMINEYRIDNKEHRIDIH